jgi:hypothetical protein
MTTTTDPIVKARAALRALGTVLLMVVEKTRGQLMAEARLALLYSLCPFSTPAEIALVLAWASDIDLQVSNWRDVMLPRKSEATTELDQIRETSRYLQSFHQVVDAQGSSEDEQRVLRVMELLDAREKTFGERVDSEDEKFDEEVIQPAVEAAGAAVEALVELTDMLVARLTEGES